MLTYLPGEKPEDQPYYKTLLAQAETNKLVAFYGTLLAGLPERPGRPPLADHITYCMPCIIPGSLYAGEHYPALVGDKGQVEGEIWRLTSSSALDLLDQWEEYYPDNPAESVYIRKPVTLISPQIVVFTYFYNQSLQGFKVIESGSWRKHLAL